MEGFNPYTLEYININDWIEENDDNIVFILSNSNILSKKSYFNDVPNSSIISEVVYIKNNISFKLTLRSNKYINLINYGINSGILNVLDLKNILKEEKYIHLYKTNNKIEGINYNYLLESEYSYNNSHYIHGFIDKSYKSLRRYTHKWDTLINKYLRNKSDENILKNTEFNDFLQMYRISTDELLIMLKQTIEDIDEEFLHSKKTEEEIVLFRGIIGKETYEGLNLSYISTTEKYEIAEGFAGIQNKIKGTLFELHIQPGIPYIYMDKISQHPGEEEILLPRNLITTVKSIKTYKGLQIIIMNVDLQYPNQFEIQNNFSIYDLWSLNINNETYLNNNCPFNRVDENNNPIDEYNNEPIIKTNSLEVNKRCYNIKSLVEIIENSRKENFMKYDIITSNDYIKNGKYIDPTIIRDPFTRIPFNDSLLEDIENMSNGMSSYHYYAYNNKILPKLPNTLTHISFAYCKNVDFVSILHCKDIIYLNLYNIKTNNFSYIGNFSKLKELNLTNTNINDISFIENCKLIEILDLTRTNISNISSLKFCINLKSLILNSCNQIYDISTLYNCIYLTNLNISFTNVIDFTPISNLKELESINLSGLSVNNLNFLYPYNIKNINVSFTGINNLEKISKFNMLTSLNISYTKVNDISNLSNCDNLEYLNIENTNITNLEKLIYCKKLKQVIFNNPNVIIPEELKYIVDYNPSTMIKEW
jgi:hypothetical protein